MTTPAPERARAQFAAWRNRVQTNYFASDPHLQSLLRTYGRDDVDAFRHFGQVSATLIDALAKENNRDEHLPRLRRWAGTGERIEQVDHHPSYHSIGRLAYGTGAMGLYAEAGREMETLVIQYLLSMNGEAGHACPFACTAGLIKILQRTSEDFPKEWLERLYDPDYETHFHGAQFLTEVQGGSDVGANAVVAHEEDGAWFITGEKWFCSVIDAQLFLVTARPVDSQEGTRGLRAFVVPRTVDGRVNDFWVRRLKFKLGTRSMASAEVDFKGARAWPVGDFRDTVDIVLNTSRLYNAICSCGSMQRAWLEASTYAKTRQAFGNPILDFPAVARIVAELRVQAYAARASTFLVAALADRLATGDDSVRAAHRMLVNLNKYWTSVISTSCVRDAIEVFGGNGAIEEFSVLPRLLRDCIVCEAWEGGHNVLCAQALRDSKKLELHLAMFGLIEEMGGDTPELQRARARWEAVLAMPTAQASLHIRDVVEDVRVATQLAALRAEAANPGSDMLLPVVIAHLEATSAAGYDPLTDAGLAERIKKLVA